MTLKPIAGRLLTLAKWLITNYPASAAIDITGRCNLKCPGCYWWKQDHPPELGDGEMIALMKGLKRRGLRAAILYGGEPALRPGICRAAGGIFDSVLAFTNGTKGFPDIRKGQWILSLDGPRQINDALRGQGVYDRAVKNLYKASRPPIVHITISRQNQACIEVFIEEMMDLPVKGVGFSFFTPNRGSEGNDFFIPLAERDRIMGRILRLRQRYGEKVALTPAMARQLSCSGSFKKWNSLSACPVRRKVLCLKSDGQPKTCTYGDDADCSRCGCAAVATYQGALKPLNYATLRVIAGLMTPEAEVSPSFSYLRLLRDVIRD